LSHIVEVKTQVRDHAAVAAACRRLALPEPVRGTAELYSGEVSGLIVHLPDWTYPVVIDTETGTICYDNYNGARGDEAHLRRSVQAYVTQLEREALSTPPAGEEG
jgi:hypothetical protein